MFKSRSTRRAILSAAIAGGVVAGGALPAAAGGPEGALHRLGLAVQALQRRARHVDFADDGQALAYYAEGDQVVEAIIAARAREIDDLRVKAEAIAWACASRTDFALGDTASERLMGSILQDLLAA